MFGAKREEAIGRWKNLKNDEPHNLYISLNIIRMIKSLSIRLVGQVTRIRER